MEMKKVTMNKETMERIYMILEAADLINQDLTAEEKGNPWNWTVQCMLDIEANWHDQIGGYLKDKHDRWIHEPMGGGNWIWFKDYVCKDGKVRCVGLGDEIFINDCDWNEMFLSGKEWDENFPAVVEGPLSMYLSRASELDVLRKWYEDTKL